MESLLAAPLVLPLRRARRISTIVEAAAKLRQLQPEKGIKGGAERSG